MEVTEIVLLAAGVVILILSFLIPDRREKKQNRTMAPVDREEVRVLVGQELDAVREHVDDVVNEAVTYAMEKTERSLERLSNEKIMAINEYSDTVLSEIHRNHEEAMFLYDMLNSKHVNLKNTVSEVARTVKEAEETVNTFQKLAPEPVAPAPVAVSETPVPDKVSVSEPPAAPAVSAHPAPKAAFVRAAEEQMAKAEAEGNTCEPEITAPFQPEDAPVGESNSNDRILRLYESGMDKVSIARELGLGVGEVRLVIDLFNSQDQGK